MDLGDRLLFLKKKSGLIFSVAVSKAETNFSGKIRNQKKRIRE